MIRINMNTENKQINESIINECFKNTPSLCDFQVFGDSLTSLWCYVINELLLWVLLVTLLRAEWLIFSLGKLLGCLLVDSCKFFDFQNLIRFPKFQNQKVFQDILSNFDFWIPVPEVGLGLRLTWKCQLLVSGSNIQWTLPKVILT